MEENKVIPNFFLLYSKPVIITDKKPLFPSRELKISSFSKLESATDPSSNLVKCKTLDPNTLEEPGSTSFALDESEVENTNTKDNKTMPKIP